MKTITSVVEGHGEVAAVPELLRRVAREFCGLEIEAPPSHRVPKGSMVNTPNELSRAVVLQGTRAGADGAVVVLCDADRDDPAELSSTLAANAGGSAGDRLVVAVAVQEYEAWLLYGLSSLATLKSVNDEATPPDSIEGIRDCKGALSRNMTGEYGEVLHQVSFTSQVDLQVVYNGSSSFRFLVNEIMTRLT